MQLESSRLIDPRPETGSQAREDRPPGAGRTVLLLLALALLGFAMVVAAPSARSQSDLPGSALEAIVDGKASPLPVLMSDMKAHIQGDLASVRVTQVFENPYEGIIHARYVFPLPSNAAVHAMRMISGDRMIEAEIRLKPEARALFDAAKARGNQAALLSQKRPNVFSQEIANLMPGAPIRVELEYAHVVDKQDGDFVFHYPNVVGPRYLPAPPVLGDVEGLEPMGGAPTRKQGEPEPLEIGTWKLPASAPVAAPGGHEAKRVSIDLTLEAGLPIRFVESPSHSLKIDRTNETIRRITLGAGRVPDEADFVLRYGIGGMGVSAGATTAVSGGEGYVSLLIEPPSDALQVPVTPRELVFVLDTSGSMSGTPMDASKRFMRRMLTQLRPGDHFRIIRFSDVAGEWSAWPMPATPQNIQAGQAYVSRLSGGGGTNMSSGIRAALAPPIPDGAVRLVVFLTDGYIGNDIEIVRLIGQQRGAARFFSFGVGNSVNRYLIREMARVGRGTARIVLPHEDAGEAADRLAMRLQSPVLTDVEIDFGTAPVEEVTPIALPDLFLGESVRVIGRVAGSGLHEVTVHGKLGGLPVELPVELQLDRDSQGSVASALPILWARAQIEDRMTSFLDPGRNADARAQLKEEVTELGLAHRLVTQWTSFVAIAKPIVNPGGKGVDSDVGVSRVKGLADSAYPAGAIPGAGKSLPNAAPRLLAFAASQGFNGSAAPEPGTWTALAGLSLMGALLMLRRRRRHARA